MEIAARLDREQAQKLAFIQDKTKQNLDEVLASAIDRYYEQVSIPNCDRLERLSQLGFIGCIEAEPDTPGQNPPGVSQGCSSLAPKMSRGRAESLFWSCVRVASA